MEIDQIDSGIEENEEHFENKKEDNILPISPFNSNLSSNYSINLKKSNEDSILWTERKSQLDIMLQTLNGFSYQMSWISSTLPTMKMFTQEVKSLSEFYQFLLVQTFSFFLKKQFFKKKKHYRRQNLQ